MNISFANIAFGLIPALMLCAGIWVTHSFTGLRLLVSRKTVIGVCTVILLGTGFSLSRTYAPRVVLNTPATTPTPETVEVPSKPEIFTTDESRVGQFDKRLDELVAPPGGPNDG